MKRKWVEGGPSGGPSNPVGKFFINPTDPRTVEELKAIHTQEAEGKSNLNRFFPTTNTLDVSRRHPFIDYVMGAQLSTMWKGFKMDRYDGTTNLDEHMDVYTTHMSLYTLNCAVLCRVFPTSLKGGALS